MTSNDPFGFLGDMGRIMSMPVDGPVAWELAEQTALAIVSAPPLEAGSDAAPQFDAIEAEPTVQAESSLDVEESVRLADLWLDPVTGWPSGVTLAQSWSSREWVLITMPLWRRLCDPVAASVARTMRESMTDGLTTLRDSPEALDDLAAELGAALPEGLELPEGFDPAQMVQSIGPMIEMMERVCAVMLGGQIGQAIGRLAGEVQSSTDIGIPLAELGRAALLPAAVSTYAQGLGVDGDQVSLYLALREAAHHRLYAHVPWLLGHVLAAVEAYAQGVEVDPNAIQARIADAVTELDPEALADPERLQQALASGLFAVEPSAAQQMALSRLETLLALIEGWVEHVVGAAAADRLPSLDALRESMRRRRAAGGPAEQTFSALVGLDLRPKRLRAAADLWAALEQARGQAGRDAVWGHPDLLPSSSDLDDPTEFLASESGDL